MLERRTLPLTALRAFECAGRHLHLQKAGAELGVSQSAISHQVRLLEESLGVRLFERSGNRLSLTPSGKQLLEQSSEAFDRLINATEGLAPDTIAGKLTIGCTTNLLVSLLMDTISRFHENYPEVDLEIIEIKPKQRDIPREVDLAFCYGEPAPKDRQIEALMTQEIFPVASPALLQTVPRITRASQLLQLPLLHDNLGYWKRWLSAAGQSAVAIKNNLVFFNTHVTLIAARAGLGVALATWTEVHRDLHNGSLVKVLERSIPEPDQYYLVTHYPELQTSRARIFERWFREDFAEYQ